MLPCMLVLFFLNLVYSYKAPLLEKSGTVELMGFIKKQIKMEIAALSVDIQVSVCIYTHTTRQKIA